jgi:signal transduction histidine kinase
MSKEEEFQRLGTINDTAKLVISDLRETIWALKKEAIPMEELADRLKGFIQLQRTLQPGMEMIITEAISSNISFSPTEALNIFRICQEAIVNSIKHANATKLDITIQSGPDNGFVITIRDNGRGFSDTLTREEHYGLENMQHRAAELGALLLIDSMQGKGTTLVLRNQYPEN